MPHSASIEKIFMESSSVASTPSSTTEETFVTDGRRFSHLRGVRWRIDLGILTCSLSASIDDLRRTTAESRRRYAALRRKLLVDPHIPKDGSNSPEPVIDNPLSQSPDSMWGRFFRNAELERMLDQDLTRLYPEQANYFQTAGCQSMLRRILLLWCLRHPECGYRQGMHELLAPLLYVLQSDLEHLAQARKLYEDHFVDNFDADSMYNFDFKKFPDYMEEDDESSSKIMSKKKICSLDELDPKIKEIVLLSDAYGAEGELGVVLSEKFLEHDAYCMFDASMNGSSGGAVAMVDFFLPFPLPNSQTGLSPAIEVSSAWYHLLSIVDSSLYSHLVELGVEPQYFALRWLRVLFGREFSLENLLIIWDNIYACDNRKMKSFDNSSLNSMRGAFISSLAVSMILYLRSSLLATENPTSCLKRLLNFPNSFCLEKLIGKAKSLLVLALDPNNLTPLQPYSEMVFDSKSRSAAVRGHSLSSDSVSPMSPLSLVPDSYWEEKWRILHNREEEEEEKKQIPNWKTVWSEKVKMRLSRTGSVPSSPKVVHKPLVRRNLLKDLEKELESDENSEECSPAVIDDGDNEDRHLEEKDGKVVCEERGSLSEEGGSLSSSGLPSTDNNNNGDLSNVPSDDKIDDESNEVQLAYKVVLSSETQMEDDSVTEFSSVSGPKEEEVLVTEITSVSGPNEEVLVTEISSVSGPNEEVLVSEISSVSGPMEEVLSLRLPVNGDDGVTECRPISGPKEQKVLLSKFPWLWKFGRSRVEGGSQEKVANDQKIQNSACTTNTVPSSQPLDVSNDTSSSSTSKGEAVDVSTLRNIGGSMLENIQVIESSIIQQDWGQGGSSLESFSKNILAGKGQVAAVAALKELRKISNLLLEM
ncbi:uncharacterized protein LOC124913914 [Impatiens glandulifera]|uniref:uncharacterized protein LOC124913914 n=1 Tax=Impatiens glandulifera TaxID=253017 RepID=UPI001FB04F5D|nr:uncharacterized protein LOC124913914 [Impatiens glandulifera]